MRSPDSDKDQTAFWERIREDFPERLKEDPDLPLTPNQLQWIYNIINR